MTDCPQYNAAHVHRALTEDPRTAEQGVEVTLHGELVVLTGSVTTEERKRQLETVVHEHLPNALIDNYVLVTPPAVPNHTERLDE